VEAHLYVGLEVGRILQPQNFDIYQSEATPADSQHATNMKNA
jgi:hypothetical protein